MADEKALVKAMLAGEEQAFEEFFHAYFARVYRFVLPRLNGDVEAAKEVVQSTLAKVMRRLRDFRGESTLFTWICQICRREAVDYIRARRREMKRVVLIDDDPELRLALAAVEAPEDYDLVRIYGRTEASRLVRAVLDRLPHDYGNALEWKYMEGHSVQEIGARLGIGTTAAQSLLARARAEFRRALEQVFGADASDIAASLGT